MTVIDNFGQSNSTAWPITPKTNGGGALYPDETGLTSVAGGYRGVEFYGANGLTLAKIKRRSPLACTSPIRPTSTTNHDSGQLSAVLDLSYGEALVRNEPSFNLPAATGFKLDFLSYVPPGSGQLTVQGDAYHVVNLAHWFKVVRDCTECCRTYGRGCPGLHYRICGGSRFWFHHGRSGFLFSCSRGLLFRACQYFTTYAAAWGCQSGWQNRPYGSFDCFESLGRSNSGLDGREFRRLRNGWSFGPDLCSQ